MSFSLNHISLFFFLLFLFFELFSPSLSEALFSLADEDVPESESESESEELELLPEEESLPEDDDASVSEESEPLSSESVSEELELLSLSDLQIKIETEVK